MMAAIAFLALALAVIVQSVLLQQALIREQVLRAEAKAERALALEAQYARMPAGAQAARQQHAPPAAPQP
jgi:hypothetical protein